MEFIERIAPTGLHWARLPATPSSSSSGSPYSGPSAFAGDPQLLGLEGLEKCGDLKESLLENYYSAVRTQEEEVVRGDARGKLLLQAYRTFLETAGPEAKYKFQQWCEGQSYWLKNFAAFTTICKETGTKNWPTWDPPCRDRDPEAIRKVIKSEQAELEMYIQWRIAQQARDLKNYAHKLGVLLLGDRPAFLGHGSDSVWALKNLYHLGKNGKPSVVAGSPPDSFTGFKHPQVWGMPVHNWGDGSVVPELTQWWINSLHRNFEFDDIIRIDHFRSIYQYYAIENDDTRSKGRWYPGPGGTFLERIVEAFGQRFFVEDLGSNIGPEVYDLRDRNNLPGMTVAQLAPWGEPQVVDNIHFPDNYTAPHVAYVGTHDNPTSREWFDNLNPNQQMSVCKYLGATPATVVHKLVEKVFSSDAGTAIVTIGDVLELGSEGRINEPGTGSERIPPNWKWRLPSYTGLDKMSPWLTAIASR